MQTTSALYNTILADSNHWFETQIVIDGVGTFGEDKLFSVDTTTEALQNLPQVGIAASGEINLVIVEPETAIPRMAKITPFFRAAHTAYTQGAQIVDDILTPVDATIVSNILVFGENSGARVENDIIYFDALIPGTETSEWLPNGVFWLDTREYRTYGGESFVSIHGYDAMLKAEDDYPSTNHSWPYLDTAVVAEIATAMGVSVDARTTAWLTAGYLIELPTAYTMRETLEHIAAAYGGNFVMSAEGKLLFVPLCGMDEPSAFDYLADENGNALVFGSESWCILV